MLSSQARLNDHLQKWNQAIQSFERALHDFAQAKATYEHRVAVIKTTAGMNEQKPSMAFLDTLANADEEAARLHLQYRAAEANVEALKARLRWCQACADALRSEIATERAQELLYTERGPDP